MSDKIREAFEVRFPRPKGAFIDTDGCYSGGEWVSFYNARWEAWQSALAQQPAPVAVPESEKKIAHRKVRNAIKRGDLERPSVCSRCGEEPKKAKGGRAMIHAHHHDYQRPLDVEWICARCHREETPLPKNPGAPARGESNGQSKLSEKDVIAARRLRADGLVYREIADRFGVNKRTIMRAIKGQQWAHIESAAAPAAPVARFLPDIPEQMARDLARFNETCEDGQEYDIPKERMRAMASFGLVRWCGGSRFEITDCGMAALEVMAAPPAAEQPTGTTSDQYRAELYDEVWEKARSMGYGNVTEALVALEQMKAVTEQPGTVKVPRETAIALLDDGPRHKTWLAQDELRALLDGGEE